MDIYMPKCKHSLPEGWSGIVTFTGIPKCTFCERDQLIAEVERLSKLNAELEQRRTADLMTEEVEALGNILSSIATLCAQHRTFHGEAAADAEFGPGLRVLAKIIAGAWVKP